MGQQYVSTQNSLQGTLTLHVQKCHTILPAPGRQNAYFPL